MKAKLTTISLTLLFLFYGCESLNKNKDSAINFSNKNDTYINKIVGNAKWYGLKKDGEKTSSGENFNVLGMEATSPDLPIGTHVWVTNLKNEKKVKLMINNHQKLKKGFVLDMSYSAAKELDFHKEKYTIVEVQIEEPANVLSLEEMNFNKENEENKDKNIISLNSLSESYPSYKFPYGKPTEYTIQVGAFISKNRAENYRNLMQSKFNEEVYIAIIEPFHKVWIGNFESYRQAKSFRQMLIAEQIETMNPNKPVDNFNNPGDINSKPSNENKSDFEDFEY